LEEPLFNKIAARAAALLAAAAIPVALSALPAQAAIPADGTVADGQGFIVTKSIEDAGGVKYTISVDFNYKYTYQGVTRVSVNPLTVYRSDANVLATGNPEDAGLDLHFDAVNSSGTIIQHKVYDAIDLDAAADNQASFNPANVRSNADDPDDEDDPFSYYRVKVGTDGDGKGSSVWVIFPQPAGIGFKAAS
jgi:hypothetical protein